MLPRVSVVIPAYNAEKYIGTTLRSLLDQTCDKLEVVVIDDGSTDRTAEVARSALTGTDWRYSVITQPHAGVSAARNHGLRVATGMYILFLDADDYLAPECLSLMSQEMESTCVDMAFCGHDAVSEDGTLVRSYESRYTYLPGPVSGVEALVDTMKERILPWTGSTMYRKGFLDETGLRYTQGRTYAEDIEFIWKALFRAAKVSSVHQVLSYYVQRAGSTTGAALMERFQGLDVLFDLLDLFSSKDRENPAAQCLRNYRLPVDITGLFGALAGKGVPIAELLSVLMKEPRYRATLAGFRAVPDANLASRRKVQVRMFARHPRLYLLLCHMRESLVLTKSRTARRRGP